MYEFLCNDCNTIYTFLSRRIDTVSIPPCPKVPAHELCRQISRFAVTGSSKNGTSDDDSDDTLPDLPIDEAKMERALESLASEAEGMNEDDPRQAAQLMRKLTDMTGLKLGDKMEDALSRMEAGEDPDTIEQELGDMNESDLFTAASSRQGSGKRPPQRDETLYEM